MQIHSTNQNCYISEMNIRACANACSAIIARVNFCTSHRNIACIYIYVYSLRLAEVE